MHRYLYWLKNWSLRSDACWGLWKVVSDLRYLVSPCTNKFLYSYEETETPFLCELPIPALSWVLHERGFWSFCVPMKPTNIPFCFLHPYAEGIYTDVVDIGIYKEDNLLIVPMFLSTGHCSSYSTTCLYSLVFYTNWSKQIIKLLTFLVTTKNPVHVSE